MAIAAIMHCLLMHIDGQVRKTLYCCLINNFCTQYIFFVYYCFLLGESNDTQADGFLLWLCQTHQLSA